jgi:TRAP-type C4-dicarboxylate transport system permease small subunit
VLRAIAQLICQAVAWLEGLATALFAVAVVLEIVNLVWRWFGGGIPEAAEFSSLVMVAIAFLGMARGFLSDEHVRFIALEKRLREQWRLPFLLVAIALNAITLFIVGLLGIGMTAGFIQIGNTAFSMTWMPLWVWAITIPVGAFLSLAALVVAAARAVASGQKEPTKQL